MLKCWKKVAKGVYKYWKKSCKNMLKEKIINKLAEWKNCCSSFC